MNLLQPGLSADRAPKPAAGSRDGGLLLAPGAGWVLLLALVLRVAWSVLIPVEPLSDSVAYDILAQNMVAGEGYTLNPDPAGARAAGEEVEQSAYWAVGTPAVVALLYAVFGHTYVPVVILNILIALVGIAVTMRLVAEWLSPRHATAAGLALACWPGQIGFVTAIGSELWFTLGVLLVMLVWTRTTWPWWRRSLLAGVLLAISCYIRPVAMLLPIVLVMVAWAERWLATRRPGDRAAPDGAWWSPVVASLAATVVMVGLVAPWTARNARVMGAPAFVSMNSGANMWMGNHPGTDGQYAELPPETDDMYELERDVYLKTAAKDYIRAEPVAFVLRTLKKFVILHSNEVIFVYWNETSIEKVLGKGAINPLKALGSGYWLLMVGGALVGVVMLMLRAGFWAVWLHPAWMFWGYFAAVHAVIVVQDRYHYPSVPFVAAFVSVPLLAVYSKLTSGKRAAAAPDAEPQA